MAMRPPSKEAVNAAADVIAGHLGRGRSGYPQKWMQEALEAALPHIWDQFCEDVAVGAARVVAEKWNTLDPESCIKPDAVREMVQAAREAMP